MVLSFIDLQQSRKRNPPVQPVSPSGWELGMGWVYSEAFSLWLDPKVSPCHAGGRLDLESLLG